jgi:hypothetical protein
MSNLFKFTYPTFDNELEFREDFLDIPSEVRNEVVGIPMDEYKSMTATVSEITASIVSVMMTFVKRDLSTLSHDSRSSSVS